MGWRLLILQVSSSSKTLKKERFMGGSPCLESVLIFESVFYVLFVPFVFVHCVGRHHWCSPGLLTLPLANSRIYT
ncbi:hypothetical protein LINPERPRIM_LOCUS20292, partial [Linum perenne]